MRTTVTLADDVAAAIERVRRERAIGLSDAVNDLIRVALTRDAGSERFEQQTHDMGSRIDLTDVADAIETLDGARSR